MNVLFLEDELPARAGISPVLAALGHLVHEAGTVEDGIDWMRKQPYDLLLLDCTLPATSRFPNVPNKEVGVCFLRALRRRSLGDLQTPPDVRVVAITAVADLGVTAALKDLKALLILQKPIDAKDAVERIRKAL